MGSLNDVLISKKNNHNISENQEPWVNCLFEYLKSLCWYIAKHDNNKVSFDEIKQNLHPRDNYITGWRCFNCAYAELTTWNIDSYIAWYIIKDDIISYLAKENLKEIVENIWLMNSPRIEQERQNVRTIIRDSNINLTERVGWLRPCPSCNDNDTGVYRWLLVTKKKFFCGYETSFRPADNNLPIRRKHVGY